MARRRTVPITGRVLAWAIESSGLRPETIAKRLRVSVEQLSEWQDERSAPTVGQLKRLADVLNRPTAFFMLPSPPDGPSVTAFFRAAQSDADRTPTPVELEWIEKARRLQEVTAWASRQLELGLADVPTFHLRVSPERAADRARARLGIAVHEQLAWTNAVEAFQSWTAALERQRVVVFRLPMGKEAARGFALWDDWAPVAVINTAYRWTEQRIFTLLHEYGHLTLRDDAVDGEVIHRPDMTDSPDVESWCHRFAAAVLLPAHELSTFLANMGYSSRDLVTDVDDVEFISSSFKVSLRATAIRLIHLQRAHQSLYDKVKEIATVRDYQRSPGRSREPRRRPRIRLDQYGRNVAETLAEAVTEGVMSEFDLADYLDLSLDDLPGFYGQLGLTS